MKQKIFSLLVLMITTVCGAWAQDVETFRVQLSVNCSALNVENGLFYSSEWLESELKGGKFISEFALEESYFHQKKGLVVEISQIESPSYPPGFSYDGSDFLIWMLGNQKFNANVSIPITVKEGAHEYEGSVTVSVYHNTHSSTATVWQKDATYHWHQCNYGYGMCDGSDDSKVDLAPHTYSSGSCQVCGQDEPHVHSFSTDTWIQTETHHFRPCFSADCPLSSAHDLNNPMQDEAFFAAYDALTGDDLTAFAYGEHVDTNEDGKCDACGYEMNSMVDPTHEHVPGNVWTWDANHADYHYLPCSVDGCDITDYYTFHQNEGQASNIFSYEGHTYVNGICVKCNYDPNASPSAHVHTPAEAWVQKTGYHYHKCSVAGCDYNSEDLTAELFTNNSTLANALSYGVHVDSQEPIGLCDKCGYNLVVVHAHDFESTVVYGKNDNYHWLICQAQNCPLDYEAIAAYTSADNSAEVQAIKNDVAWAEHDYTSGLLDNTCICGKLNPAHTHVPSDSWTKKDTYHYKKCTVTGCTLNSDNLTKAELEALNGDTQALLMYGSHVDDNPADGLCDQCGYQITQGHTHTLDPNWVWKDEYHYHMCTEMDCPFHNANLTPDDFADVDDQETFRFGEHDYGSHGEQYYTCKICGFENQERKAQKHTEHKYQWAQLPTGNSDANGFEHWQQCTNQTGYCDALFIYPDESEKKHKFNDEATDETYYICSICGYVDIDRRDSETRPHAHEFSTKWTWTEDTQNEVGVHYHKCISNQGTCPLNYDGFDNEALEVYGFHEYGTSQEGTAYYMCKTCGYESEARKSQPHTHQYGDWVYNSDDHWKVCSATEGACAAPMGFKGPHSYYATDDASTPDIDERAQCSTCPFYNQARANAIKNAASAAKVQSWSWDYEIPFNFEAPVLNDRRMNAEQCYTIFLPYALELNGLKGYALEQHNDYIIGFKEQAVPKLPQLIPFVVKPEKTGNPLNSTTTTIYMTLQSEDQADWMTEAEKQALISDRGYANSQPSIHSTGGRLYMLGSLKYLTGNAAGGRYIMQGKDAEHPNGVFKMIDGSADAGYDKVDNRSCILPMRAHIETLGGDARQLLTVVFYDADGSATAVENITLDDDAPVIYDLQGRRVQNPRKGGLYIINGRKAVLK